MDYYGDRTFYIFLKWYIEAYVAHVSSNMVSRYDVHKKWISKKLIRLNRSMLLYRYESKRSLVIILTKFAHPNDLGGFYWNIFFWFRHTIFKIGIDKLQNG